jgi:hypothetical protein
MYDYELCWDEKKQCYVDTEEYYYGSDSGLPLCDSPGEKENVNDEDEDENALPY